MVIGMCERGHKKMTDQLERGIVKIYPKTYTFTNMPEKIMSNNSDSFSVAIVQPSIIGF